MNDKTFSILEYQRIKEELKKFTVSDLGKKLVDKLTPSSNLETIRRRLNDTSEAKRVLNKSGNIPLQGLYDIINLLDKVEKGGVLQASELISISDFLRGCRRMKKFMNSQEIIAPVLSTYRYSIAELQEIEAEINSSIEGNRVSSNASNKLGKIRKQISINEERIEQKLNSIINSSKYKRFIQDFFISKRNDRFVIPIKSSYKNQVEGNIVDISATGSTVFIEPASIAKFCNELIQLRAEEEVEEYQILATITGFIGLHIKEIKLNLEVMGEYDFVFAKCKYSNAINGEEVQVNDQDYIKIVGGIHPLLGEDAVPLDFECGKDFRTLIITGPNTGGKTVVLKTIGLLTLMVQSGLHVKVKEGTEMAVFEKVLVDIGDNQSIQQSLSTFSGHIKNIIEIMNKSTFSTLVLLDEIGTGTDPSEGAGLAAAILDDLYKCGSITIATTHYGEIKDFALQHNGFENGCMEFDSETLKPLYKLAIGKVGNSNALWISEKMGMRPRVLKAAQKYIEDRGKNEKTVKFQIDDYELKISKPNNKKKHEKSKRDNENKNKERELQVGDCVKIGNSDKKGIIYKLEDKHGDMEVLIEDQFKKVSKKRVNLFIEKEKLYPPGYDLDVIFVPWKRRKFENDISRGAVKNVNKFRERLEEIEDI